MFNNKEVQLDDDDNKMTNSLNTHIDGKREVKGRVRERERERERESTKKRVFMKQLLLYNHIKPWKQQQQQ